MKNNPNYISSSNEIDPITGMEATLKPTKVSKIHGVNNDLGAMTPEQASGMSRVTDIPMQFSNDERSIYDEGALYGEDIAQHRHEEQGFFPSLGSALVQTGTTLVGQTIQGLGYMADLGQLGRVLDGSEKEFNNWFSQIGTDIVKAGEEIAPIYQDPNKTGQFSPEDWTWWAANAPSIASTLSFFIPGMAVAKGVSALGEFAGLAKLGKMATWVTEGVIGGMANRYMESTMEANSTLQDMRQLIGTPLNKEQAAKISKEYGINVPLVHDNQTGLDHYVLDEKTANEAGGKAAANNFKDNMVLAAMDIPQFLLATAPFGKVTEGMTAGLAKQLGKGLFPVVTKNSAITGFEMGSEGFEEGYQYISNERSKEIEMARMGLVDPTTLGESIQKHIGDGDFYTSALFGALGAGVMMVAGHGIEKIKAKKNGGLTGAQERVANAASWMGTVKEYTDQLNNADQSGDKESYDRIHNDYMIDLGTNAAQVGNLGHLTDLIERGKTGTNEDNATLGFDESMSENLRANGDKMNESLNKIGKIYQKHLNETSDYNLANILTKADIKVDNYTDATRKSDTELNKIVNDDNNWTPTGVPVSTPVPSNLKTATKIDAEIAHWDASKNAFTRLLNEAQERVGTGVESNLTSKYQTAIDRIDNKIVELQKNREDLGYSKEEQAKDATNFQFKKSNEDLLNKTAMNKVINENNLMDNLHDSKFYRTKEGQDTLKKENYKVEKKQVEKEVEQSDNAADILSKLDDTEGTEHAKTAKETTKNKADTVTPTIVDEEIPQTGVSQTEGLFTGGLTTEEAPVQPVAQEEVIPEQVIPQQQPIINEEAGMFADETYGQPVVTNPEIVAAQQKFDKFIDNNYPQDNPNSVHALANDMHEFIKQYPEYREPIANALQGNTEGFRQLVHQAIASSIASGDELDIGLKDALAQFYKAKNDKLKEAQANSESTLEQTTKKDNIITRTANKLFIKFANRGNNTSIVPTMYTNPDLLNQKLLNQFGINENESIQIALHSKDSYANQDAAARKYVLFVERGGKKIIIGNIPTSNQSGTNEEKAILKKLREDLFEYFKDSKNITGDVSVYKVNGNPLTTKIAGYTGEYSIDIKEVDGVDKVQRHSPNTNKLVKPKEPNSTLGKLMSKAGGFILGAVTNSNGTGVIEWGKDKTIPNVGEIKINKSDDSRVKLSNTLTQTANDEVVVTYIKPHDVAKATKRAKELGVSYEQYVISTYGESRGYNIEEYGSEAEATTSAKEWLKEQYDLESKGSLFVAIPNPAAPWDILNIRAFYTPLSELQGKTRETLLKAINERIERSVNANDLIKNLKEIIYINKNSEDLIKKALTGVKSFNEVKDILTGKTESTEYGIIKSIINNARINAIVEMFNAEAGVGNWKHSFIENKGDKTYNQAVGDYMYFTINPSEPLTNVSPIIDLDAFNQTSKPQPQKVTKSVDVSITPAKPIIPTVSESVVNNPVVLEMAQEAVVEKVKPTEPSTKSFSIDMSLVDELLNITEISDKVEQPIDIDKQSDNDEVITKLSQSNETVVKDSKEEIEWFKKYFPNISIGELEDIKDMVRNITEHGHTAWAAYHNAAIWLRDKMPEGTVYHETFHVIYNLALTPKERNQLLAQAEGNTVTEKEEWLADKFKSILLTNKPDVATKGFIAKIFRKLNQLVRAIWSNKNGLTLHELANRVEQGKYTKLRTDKFNDSTLRLYREIAGWDYSKSKVATDTINKYIVSDLLPLLRNRYPEMAGMSDADVMNSYIKSNKDTYALHRIVSEMFKKKAELMTGENKANLLDLISKMFNNNGEALPLVLSSLEEFNKNQGIIVKITGANNKQISVEQYMDSVDDDTSKAEVYDVNFIAKSSKNDAPSRVKNVLRYLKTGTTNMFGLPSYYNYDQTYNTILRKTSGVTSVAELISILEKNANNYPQYNQLINMINKDSEFGTLMFQAFNRPNIPFYYMYGKNNKVVISDANKSKVAETLYSNWEYNFNNIASNFFKGAIHGKNGEKVLKKYTEIVTPFTNGVATMKGMKVMSKLLSSIGLDVGVDNLNYLQGNLSSTDLNNLFNNNNKSIKVILKSLNDKINPFEDGNSNSVKSLKYLSELVKDASPDLFETSHISVGGEKVYSQIIPQFISNLMHDLHNPEKVLDILDKYSRDPLFATGRVVRKINEVEEPFNVVVDLKGVKFNNAIIQRVADIFAANKYEASTIPGAIARNDKKADIIREQLSDLINIGIMEGSSINNAKKEYSEMEDVDLKHASMHMFFYNNTKNKAMFRMPPLSDSPNMLTMIFDRLSKADAIKAIINIANGEYNRIQSIKNNNTGVNIVNYDVESNKSTDTGYHIATMFNGFKGNPIEDIDKATKLIEETYKDNSVKYIQKLIKYKLLVFNGDLIDVKKSKLSNDLLAEMHDKAGVLKFVTDMLMNTTVATSSLSTLSIGDPAFYKSKDKSTAVDYIKRAKEIFSPKSLPDINASYTVKNEDGSTREVVNVDKEYNSIYVKDVEVVAPSMESITNFVESQVKANIITKEAGDNLISQYEKVNHTDAQAFITLPFYRKTMVAHGLWTKNMQDAYDRLIVGKGNGVDLIVLQPIKPFMFNQKFNQGGGMMVPNQHKNSEFILMPQLVNENPKLKALYDHMMDNNIDIANFNSAVKVGEYDSIGFDELTSGTQTATIHKIDMLQRGIQQETPEHHIGASGKVSTQLQVNAIANLQHLDVNGNKITYNVGNKKFNSKQLVEHYLDIIEENLRSSYEDSFRDEFLTDNKLDWEKVSNILKLAAEGEQLPQDFVDAISYDENTGKIKLPPFDPLFGSKMEAIFHSMVRNKITKQTVQQSSLIQLSSVGLSEDLKLVFGNKEDREQYEKDLADSNNNANFTPESENELWNNNKEMLLDKFDNLQYEDFAKLNNEEQERLINCNK